MTEQEFLEHLRRTPRDWRLVRSAKGIRLGEVGDHCPLTAVCGNTNLDVRTCAYLLRLPGRLAWRIADAADNTPVHDRELRAKLLDACGLTEAP
jgi:hypothetical protein